MHYKELAADVVNHIRVVKKDEDKNINKDMATTITWAGVVAIGKMINELQPQNIISVLEKVVQTAGEIIVQEAPKQDRRRIAKKRMEECNRLTREIIPQILSGEE